MSLAGDEAKQGRVIYYICGFYFLLLRDISDREAPSPEPGNCVSYIDLVN